MTFEAFFKAIHDYDPFPWQSRLAKQVNGEGWPDVLDLPTGVGKTNALDIAVYHLIEQVRLIQVGKLERRDAALRIFFIVDRRIVVDGAYQHARSLAKKLRESNEPVLVDARELLRQHFQVDSEDEPIEPLTVSLMRGGMYRDDGWSLSPATPTICVSTVDQVGSRLLFRGYGVSPSIRPVHAGLVGNDSLLLLDEAHLSNPFVETLKSVQLYMNPRFSEQPVGRPPRVVQMSATVDSQSSMSPPFQLEVDDREHDVINERLSANKVARLEKVPVNKDDPLEADNEFAATAVARAVSLSTIAKADDARKKRKSKADSQEASKGSVIGIVVNRVRTARRIFELLCQRADIRDPAKEVDLALETTKADVVLLTGRIRPADRDELLFRKEIRGKQGWMGWIEAGRDEEPNRPVFVVATQTIEVGADLDFDAIVTEAAPLDCLRQRFGRLDRRGKRKLTAAFVLGRSTDVAKTAKDRVYGDRLTKTWDWLQKNASGKGKNKTIDFGVDSLETLLASANVDSLCAEKTRAPVLLPTYLNLWARTNPAPVADPDVSLFLHGPQSRPADVQVVWRADLWDIEDDIREPESQKQAINTLALLPPTSVEACSIPIYEVQRWLGVDRESKKQERFIGDVSDVEGDASPNASSRRQQKSGKLILRWKGEDESRIDAASEICPGDTIVVPSSYGGHDDFGWNPDSRSVTDIGECGSRWGRAKPVVRFHPSLLAIGQWGVASPEAIRRFDDLDEDAYLLMREFLMELCDEPLLPEAVRLSCLSLLVESGRIRFTKYVESGDLRHGWIATARKRLPTQQVLNESSGQWEPDSENTLPDASDQSSFLEDSEPVTLIDHSLGVQRHAVRFAQLAHLQKELINDIGLIAQWHDVGKLEESFQTLLHDGNAAQAAIAVAGGNALAKSGQGYRHPTIRRQARKQAGVPDGFRHEGLSVILLRETDLREVLAEAHDTELVQYVIGTHHGDGRASHRVVDDSPLPLNANWQRFEISLDVDAHRSAALYRLANDWECLFARMNERYGIWGLAWIEAMFRLADHRQSEKESRATKTKMEVTK
ncbi:type I-G CRISPR-associated helicase/endonuclease Cas3g [Allorhodopirellula solitaria]|uniref:CRISPR-associated endonuclease/helicase Cas3 n=1 Tax=Allorhodopirellula solitaria TaxID=2527987 RepID=A0A5C5YIX1_9BACT|nr:type I-U CRISPR-associated helicase/endonuclease Cas3 [Allorhodopirellula solitaria]TWT74822.1 CRISPR-associated endonuclease/helicase Cas3 [Allorhodopirellula solitaria]